MMPTDKEQQESLKKAEAHLDEGKKALGTHQKHIMVADLSDYSWATVQRYDVNPLAKDSEDKKRLEKAEKKLRDLLTKGDEPGTGELGRNRSRAGAKATVGGNRVPVVDLAHLLQCLQQGHEYWGHVSSVLPGVIWQL